MVVCQSNSITPTFQPRMISFGDIDPIGLINQHRADNSLHPLKDHPALMKSAQAHSDDMAARHVLTHIGRDGSTPMDRMVKSGYNCQASGECVGGGQTSWSNVINDWMNDAPHRRIVLGRGYHHIGLGMRDNYWTLDVAVGMPDIPPTPPNPKPLNENDFDLW